MEDALVVNLDKAKAFDRFDTTRSFQSFLLIGFPENVSKDFQRIGAIRS